MCACSGRRAEPAGASPASRAARTVRQHVRSPAAGAGQAAAPVASSWSVAYLDVLLCRLDRRQELSLGHVARRGARPLAQAQGDLHSGISGEVGGEVDGVVGEGGTQ